LLCSRQDGRGTPGPHRRHGSRPSGTPVDDNLDAALDHATGVGTADDILP
jgi:hypothetical protein